MFFNKKSAFDYAFEGEKLLLDKKYQKALEFYNKAISIAQKEKFANIDLYFSSRATINKNLGNLKEALSDINKAIEIQPKVYLYYFERSEIKELLGDTEGVQNDLKMIYEILDKNGSSHMFKIYLAKKKMEQKKYKEAETIVDTFNLSCYDNEPVLLLKVEIYEKTKNYEKKIKELDKLIEMYPLRILFFDKKIDSYIKINRNDKAIETLEKALSIEPRNSHLHLRNGQLLYFMKEHQKALEAFRKALTLNPSETDRKKCVNFIRILGENVK